MRDPGLLRRVVDRINGTAVPGGFAAALLDGEEHVLGTARTADSCLVATSLGLWLPEQGTHRRVGWHRISKARWDDPTLEIVEAGVAETVAGTEILEDAAPQRCTLTLAGRLPQTVQTRVERTIASRHRRDLPAGGVWVVQRRFAGRDGTVLQVRPDPGTDPDQVRTLATNLTRRLRS